MEKKNSGNTGNGARPKTSRPSRKRKNKPKTGAYNEKQYQSDPGCKNFNFFRNPQSEAVCGMTNDENLEGKSYTGKTTGKKGKPHQPHKVVAGLKDKNESNNKLEKDVVASTSKNEPAQEMSNTDCGCSNKNGGTDLKPLSGSSSDAPVEKLNDTTDLETSTGKAVSSKSYYTKTEEESKWQVKQNKKNRKKEKGENRENKYKANLYQQHIPATIKDQPQHAVHNNKAQVFETYWELSAVNHALTNGYGFRGILRINPKNYLDAYVAYGDLDIMVQGMPDRNRALNGDDVCVLIHHKAYWKVQLNDVPPMSAAGKSNCGKRPTLEQYVYDRIKQIQTPDHLVPYAMQEFVQSFDHSCLQKTARVVYIMEKKHSRITTGYISDLETKHLNVAKFSPTDSRLPRFLLDTKSLPKDISSRPKEYGNTLLSAKITHWDEFSVMPHGEIIEAIGIAGNIEVETKALLANHNVDTSEFTSEVLKCLPQNLPWVIPPEEFEYRQDFRSECIFTIDPSTAKDLDDAVSCKDLGNGLFEIGVHIADVSFFVKEKSALDRIAAERSTSVYLVQQVIHMLPQLLCEELCSLNPDIDRLAFSIVWKITEMGEIKSHNICRSIIRSCAKLSYQDAQKVLDNPDEVTEDDMAVISEGFTLDMIKTRIINLNKVAQNLRRNRFDIGGALRLDQVKIWFELGEDNLPHGYETQKIQQSNRLIEEFMLLANMAIANTIHKAFPKTALLRRHPEPQKKKIDDLDKLLISLGFDEGSVKSAASLQQLINRLSTGTDFRSRAQLQVIVMLCSKPMKNALYFCNGSFEDQTKYRHYALNVPLYTHFTSPIRRYPDIVVHRLLAASLDYTPAPSIHIQELAAQCDLCNDKKTAAKNCSTASMELYFNVYVREKGPLFEKGIVVEVLDKSFDVILMRPGIIKRVYCDQLDLKSYSFKKLSNGNELLMNWKKNNVTQTVKVFTEVNCVLTKAEDVANSLKVKTTIRHPMDFVQQDIEGENVPGMAIIDGQLNVEQGSTVISSEKKEKCGQDGVTPVDECKMGVESAASVDIGKSTSSVDNSSQSSSSTTITTESKTLLESANRGSQTLSEETSIKSTTPSDEPVCAELQHSSAEAIGEESKLTAEQAGAEPSTLINEPTETQQKSDAVEISDCDDKTKSTQETETPLDIKDKQCEDNKVKVSEALDSNQEGLIDKTGGSTTTTTTAETVERSKDCLEDDVSGVTGADGHASGVGEGCSSSENESKIIESGAAKDKVFTPDEILQLKDSG